MSMHVRDAGMRVLHNLSLQTGQGPLVVDEMIVAQQGLFAVFAKGGDGMLSGVASSAEWHLTGADGQRAVIANPLMENAGKLQALAAGLGLSPEHLRGLVVMTGDVKLAGSLPDTVLLKSALPYVRAQVGHVLTGPEMAQVMDALQKRIRGPSGEIDAMQNATTMVIRNHAPGRCPKCGAGMVSEILREGEHAGREIFRCSRYPACPYASFGISLTE